MPENIVIQTHVFRLITTAIIIAIAVFLFWFLRRIFKRYKTMNDPAMNTKKTWMLVLYSLLRFLVIVIAILAILSLFGVNVSGAIAGLGIAGAGAVLAVQDLLKDLIMGVTIASEHYFALGDIVDYNGYIGKVTSLTMRSTKIQSLVDGSTRSISNHVISEITVLSHMVNIYVPMPYDLPYSKALEVLDRVCTRAVKEIDAVERCISKGANEFKDSSISYLIILFCDPVDYLNTRRAVILVLQEELAQEGIQIPFPQMDVHMK